MTVFKMPASVTIMGRSSSITNAFVSGIIPCIEPAKEEVDAALKVLGMDQNTIQCAYCGGDYSEWDHLNPLVVNKAPTGYISEIHNLVPACGKCNQSKGNRNWREWITGNARLAPKNKGVQDLDSRIDRLSEYEKRFKPIRIDFESLVGNEDWTTHWENYKRVIDVMRQAQGFSDGIKAKLLDKLKRDDNAEEEISSGSHREKMNEDWCDEHRIDQEFEVILNNAEVNMKENESFQNYVKRSFRYLMESGLIGEKELKNLGDKEYCKRTFKLNHRFLAKERWFDTYNHSRSWRDPICGYYLCKEWNKSRFNELVPRYKQWVARMIRIGRLANSG